MLGGIAAAAAVSATFPGPMPVNVRLGGGTSVSQGLFIEMFATTQLVLTVIMLAAVKHKATYLAPIGIGIALFIGNMCSKLNSSFFIFNEAMVSDCLHSAGIYSSGAGINPARAFGPDVVNRSFPTYHWIYWLGPALGSLLAAFFYHIIEAFGWQTANPGQDYDDVEAQPLDLSKNTPQSGSRGSEEPQVTMTTQV
jgi:aquaporin rerated protein, other eukaryote